MPAVKIETFSEGHLGDAAGLLEERHRRHRAAGAAAARAGRLSRRGRGPLGPRRRLRRCRAPGRPRSSGTCWARRATTPGDRTSGSRSQGTRSRSPRIARDLYAAAAEHWVEQGRTRHYVLVPADEALVDAWFRRRLRRAAGARHPGGSRRHRGRSARRIRDPSARKRARSRISSRSSLALPRHQAQAPVFSERPIRPRTRSGEEWLDTLAYDDEQVLIGYLGDQPVACWSVTSIEHSRRAQRPRPARARRLHRLRRDAARVPRLGDRRRADRCLLRVGGRARLSDDGHRLARDEPARLALLAQARLPPHVPPPLPLDPVGA